MVLRADLQLLAGLVPEGSRVLDLGCGDGALLAHLFRTRACVGTGVEKDPEQVIAAIGHRVPVIELDLDHQLGEFADSSYDVVVLSRTLQTVHQPEQLLSEMARIGHRLVVSMPNFGLWRHRLRLLTGRMPVNKDLPYHWYDTPNLRMSSLYELELLFDRLGLVVERRVPLAEDARASWFSGLRPNLTAGAAIYVLHSQRWHADESLNPVSDPALR
ncbi:methionine biosynthesis protein MetW [Aestuariimicrobium kwangyangense]|uniref:methionine biosynthesis protein MetW n=1 Tax=Aestuariimicrobium kwangyangense TaxID=396389 RepID=UPI0003B63F68|nr:methionine biosynthesis protein MetW [Aestuariimicrobium kwangyangense]